MRSRFPAPGADSASRSLRRRCPIVRITAASFRSHQNSRAIVVSCTVENQFFRKARVVARFSEEIQSTSGALKRSAWTEIPSPPVWHRTCSAEFRRLVYSLEQVAGLLLSCCLAQRSLRFCQSRFSTRIRNSSLSFLIPVSRIKMTMSRRSSRVRGRQLEAKAPLSVSFPLHHQDEDVVHALSSF